MVTGCQRLQDRIHVEAARFLSLVEDAIVPTYHSRWRTPGTTAACTACTAYGACHIYGKGRRPGHGKLSAVTVEYDDQPVWLAVDHNQFDWRAGHSVLLWARLLTGCMCRLQHGQHV